MDTSRLLIAAQLPTVPPEGTPMAGWSEHCIAFALLAGAVLIGVAVWRLSRGRELD